MCRFPILLTTRELRSREFHWREENFYHDVLALEYSCGQRLQDDILGQATEVSAQPNRDERGAGWKQGLAQVATGQPASDQAVLQSASGRYEWKAWREDSGLSRLDELDRESGKVTSIWKGAGWARQELASDPSRDRLLYACQFGSLHSWDPKARASHLIQMPVRSDVSHLQVSPDGRQLTFVHANEVYSHTFGSENCSQVSDRKGEGNLARAVTHLHPQWSPDGQRLFYIVHSYNWSGLKISDHFGLVAALPDGSDRRVLLEQPMVAEFLIGRPAQESAGPSTASLYT